jgi:ribose 5-phosphate isomerase B
MSATKKTVSIGCDHAGYDYKKEFISYLEANGIEFKDLGTNSLDSID